MSLKLYYYIFLHTQDPNSVQESGRSKILEVGIFSTIFLLTYNFSLIFPLSSSLLFLNFFFLGLDTDSLFVFVKYAIYLFRKYAKRLIIISLSISAMNPDDERRRRLSGVIVIFFDLRLIDP